MVCMPGGRNRQHIGDSIPLLWPLHLSCTGGRGWRYRCRSILGSDAFGIHASRAEGQAREFSFFCACVVLIKRLGGEMVNGCWWLSILIGGTFDMQATGSERRVRLTVCFMPLVIPFFWCEGLNWACRWLPALGGCASGIHASG